MSWFWIAAAVLVPTLVALLVALPFWLNDAPLAGNLLGAGVIFYAAIASVVREHSDVQKVLLGCIGAGAPCQVHPEPFTRFAVYGFIAVVEAGALFTISLWVEERRRQRTFDAAWR